MQAVRFPHTAKTLGCGRKVKTLGCGYIAKTLGCANNNKRRREDYVAVHTVESKRQRVIRKSPEKIVRTCDHEAAKKTRSRPSSEISVREALKGAQPFLLKRKREAARASLLAIEKEIENAEDKLETLEELKMLCGGDEVVMGSFNMQGFGVELVLKKEEEEEEQDYNNGLSHLSPLKKPSSPSKTPLRVAITSAQQVLLQKKREAARASLLAMEKEIHNPEDNWEIFEQLKMLCGWREVDMGYAIWRGRGGG